MMTIKQIANRAGVSVATVSRVVNCDKNVSPKMRDKINKVIDDYGYVPNGLGRNLRRTNTGTILVLLPSMENIFYASLVKGIDAECKRQGYDALLTDTYDSYSKTLQYCDWLNRKLADGIILISPKITHNYEELQGKCVVGCSDMHPNFPCPQIDIDNVRAAFDATTHLIERGCRNIAYMGGYSASGFDRYRGYSEALKEAGLAENPELVDKNCFSFTDTCVRADALLNRARPDGVFCASDEFAVAFGNVAGKHGLKIPRDVKVVGFDNIKISLMAQPNLTTVEQPAEEMGRCAVQVLLKLIRGDTVQDKVVFGYKLIQRQSTEMEEE